MEFEENPREIARSCMSAVQRSQRRVFNDHFRAHLQLRELCGLPPSSGQGQAMARQVLFIPSYLRRMRREVSRCWLLIRCNLKMNADYGLFHLSLATKSMRERSERWLATDKRSNESRLAEIDFSLLSRRIFVSRASQRCPAKSRTSLRMALDLVLPPLVKS
jgi:hypothetical protein